ncbi:MAG: GDP-L-fucose synthase [Haliscomenobacteraceae bacterium CHB4]|nr:GDP-L-fucose synthase [Haliscomenobacteraceae bacterium CHB4]
MNKQDKIYIAGHRGMVGSAIVRRLEQEGFDNFALADSRQLDLRNQLETNEFFRRERPDYVFLAAAKVGGIHANKTYRAEFLYDNLMIEANVIEAAHQYGVKKLLRLGSSTIYPKMAPQPMKEDYLLTGPLEPTHEPYAIAKIAGIKLCDTYRSQYGCNFISLTPTNLYGPNDNYHPENSHVLPGLIRKFHTAKTNDEPFVTIWGTGTQRRELLHVDDLADACFFLMQHYDEAGFINVGTGHDIAILELAQLVQRIVGFNGEIRHDLDKPDGAPRKLLDVGKLTALGWKAKISLEDGVRAVYEEVKERLT